MASISYLIESRSQRAPAWRAGNLSAARAGMALLDGISATGEAMTSYSAFFTPQELIHDIRQLEAL